MSILQGLDPQAIAEHFGEVDTEYTWLQEPQTMTHSDEVAQLRARIADLERNSVIRTDNGAAILALEKRIAELERERDELQKLPFTHSRPEDCPCWYDYCHCNVDTLRDQIKRAEQAEMLLRVQSKTSKELNEYLVKMENKFNAATLRAEHAEANFSKERQRAEQAERERDAAQRANGILAQNAIDAADYGKRNFVMAIEQTKETMRALSLFRAANAAKRKMRKERDQLREWQERASTRQRINDRCPACGHMTLFVSDAGYLTCSWLKCPKPGLLRYVAQVENNLDAMNKRADELQNAFDALHKMHEGAFLDARKLAQNWNGVMTSVELEAIVKKYLQQ